MPLIGIDRDELAALLVRAAEEGAKRALAANAAPSCDWLDRDAVARLVGCAPDYVRRLDGLPRHGSKRLPRWKRSDVEAWLVTRPKSA